MDEEMMKGCVVWFGYGARGDSDYPMFECYEGTVHKITLADWQHGKEVAALAQLEGFDPLYRGDRFSVDFEIPKKWVTAWTAKIKKN